MKLDDEDKTAKFLSQSSKITTSNKHQQVNDEIESIRPYNFRPFLLHLNILPFFVAYIAWFVAWSHYFGIEEYPELGLIVTACIAILQVVTCLFCYWFVEFRVLMQCRRVDNPENAEVVQVTPVANNGFAELVYLHKKFLLKENSFNQPEKVIWFNFQKTKYFLDTKEKKQFQPVEFPLNHTLSHYLESKGYTQSEQQINDAISYYDLNKMVMDIPQFFELFIERATAPFFVFQVTFRI
jgi:cation-transporting ATPase 13A1